MEREILLYFYQTQSSTKDKQNHPVGIACIYELEDKNYIAGYSICSKSEHNFNKKLGLKIARGRALKAIHYGNIASLSKVRMGYIFPKIKHPCTMEYVQRFIESFILAEKWNKEITFQSVLIPDSIIKGEMLCQPT